MVHTGTKDRKVNESKILNTPADYHGMICRGISYFFTRCPRVTESEIPLQITRIWSTEVFHTFLLVVHESQSLKYPCRLLGYDLQRYFILFTRSPRVTESEIPLQIARVCSIEVFQTFLLVVHESQSLKYPCRLLGYDLQMYFILFYSLSKSHRVWNTLADY